MAKALEQTFEHEGDQQQKTNTGHHREGEKTRAYKSHDSGARFCFYAPNSVKRILQLAEDTAGAEKGQQNSDDRRRHSFARVRRCLRNIRHHIEGALIQKVTHLFRHFSPSPGWIVVENEANDCQ